MLRSRGKNCPCFRMSSSWWGVGHSTWLNYKWSQRNRWWMVLSMAHLLSLPWARQLASKTKHTKSLGLGSLYAGKDRRGGYRPYTANKIHQLQLDNVWSGGQRRSRAWYGATEVPNRVDRVSLREEAVSKPRLEEDDGWEVPTGFNSRNWDFDESHVNTFGIYFHLKSEEELVTGINLSMA